MSPQLISLPDSLLESISQLRSIYEAQDAALVKITEIEEELASARGELETLAGDDSLTVSAAAKKSATLRAVVEIAESRLIRLRRKVEDGGNPTTAQARIHRSRVILARDALRHFRHHNRATALLESCAVWIDFNSHLSTTQERNLRMLEVKKSLWEIAGLDASLSPFLPFRLGRMRVNDTVLPPRRHFEELANFLEETAEEVARALDFKESLRIRAQGDRPLYYEWEYLVFPAS